MNNLDTVSSMSATSVKLSSLHGKTPNFFRCQTKKQAFSSLR
ncbi:hypothetical protein [Candidatus Enterovibrio escicola]|nr:hypothetical protein [Candidatus Enterovibrio escacola]